MIYINSRRLKYQYLHRIVRKEDDDDCVSSSLSDAALSLRGVLQATPRVSQRQAVLHRGQQRQRPADQGGLQPSKV